jgi:hypothetical protein
MCTQKKWLRQLLILPLCFLFFTACNQNETKKTDESVTTKNDAGKNPQPDNVTFNGTLDLLYVDADSIITLEKEKRVMFCHSYRPAENLLTLDGWITKGNPSAPINLPPDVKLLKWKTGTLSIEQNLYIGNVFINKDDITTIIKAINKAPTYKYVVFEPYLESKHIVYKIHVANDPPSPAVPSPAVPPPTSLVDTGVKANPSPPRDN